MANKGTYISTASTTVVRSKRGVLDNIIVTGGTAGTIVGYDNASTATGNILFSFDSTNAIAYYDFDIEFVNGLVIVTSAATKLTVATSPESGE